MLFTPAEHGLWDTWVVPHDGRYLLFWLQNRHRRHPWDSIAMAESTDLIHWRELGTVIEKAPDAEDWLGTGRTWTAGGRHYMNFSEIRDGAQEIRFAVSDDMRTWQRLDAKPALRPDARWYPTRRDEVADTWVRWDTLVPVRDGDGWIGLVSTLRNQRESGAQGVIGLARSADGVDWTTVAPASDHPCALTEVSGHVAFGDRHYAFIGALDGNGPNLDRRRPHDAAFNGMSYWCATAAAGPYAPPAHDNELHGARSGDWSAYFGTAFAAGDGRVLWNHHWIDSDGLVWLAPMKELVEESPWRLALRYWPGLDALKGDVLATPESLPAAQAHSPIAGRPTAGNFAREADGIRGECLGTAALATLELDGAAASGCMVEATITLGECVGAGAGLFIGGHAERPAHGLVLRVAPDGSASVGRTSMGRYGPQFQHWESLTVPAPVAGRMRVRAILRDRFVELYLDDRLVRTLRLRGDESFCGRIGLWLDGCAARLHGLTAWSLALERQRIVRAQAASG